MTGRAHKLERMFSVREAVAFLRSMADAIERNNGSPLQDLDISLDEFQKLKIGLKRRGEFIQFKIKIKHGADEGADEVDAAPAGDEQSKYTSFKKRMDRNFKAMGALLAEGRLPEPAMVEKFLADSALMVGYPGYGDDCYPAYSAASEEFGRLFATGDYAAVNGQYAVLRGMKKECHARYK
ncbi:MAG: GAK system XXXCH domain-containing protein [Thermodesulfobacteriota bacterium]